MDLSMPELDGISATREVVSQVPGVRVVVLTASMDDDDLLSALRAGALGYLLKNLEADAFFELLDRALAGEPALHPQLSRKVLEAFARGDQGRSAAAELDALTERERQVLQLMVVGVTTNRQLARRLEVSENTIKFHVRNVLDKLHAHNRTQVVSHALRHGIVVPGDAPRR
jgi:DNA-binding NarL/FixJ family response regulator